MKYINSLILFVFLFVGNVKAFDVPQRPVPHRHVNDLAGILNENKRTEALEYKLNQFHDSLGVEIILVTIKSIDNIPVEQYTDSLALAWEDQAERINGVFVLYDDEDRGYAIIPGTHYKSKFSNVVIEKIESHFLKHFFKKEQYYDGFNKAADAIVNHITGKLTDYDLKTDASYFEFYIAGLFLLFAFVAIPVYIYKDMQSHHFGSKDVGFFSAMLLTLHYSPNESSYDDFKKGTGRFKVAGSKLSSFGGGAGGRW